MISRLSCLMLLLSGPAAISVGGDFDWPQWRGPHRDGHAAEQPLLKSWPSSGPKLKWEFNLAGSGYSSVAVVDGRLYTLGASDHACFALCLNTQDGSEVWRNEFSRASVPQDYNHGWGGGPRSTPAVVGDHVFVLSDVGVLACLMIETGEMVWTTDLVADHGGRIPKWGYSDSPLVDRDRVVVTPGESRFLAAFNRDSGQRVWQSKGFAGPAQYVSVVKGSVGETNFYVTASKSGLVAFDADTGAKLFSDSATGNDVAVVATPILDRNFVYHSSGYRAGNTLLELSSAGKGNVSAKPVYHLNDKTLRNHHGGMVLVNGAVFGFTRANGGTWMAQDLESGRTLWDERVRPNRSGSICYADGRLYCYNDKEGSVYLVEASRTGWNQKGKLTLPQQTKLPRDKGAIWAHPIVAEQSLVIRDQELIFAYEVGRK